MPAVVNYSTKIAAIKTVGEIQTMLAEHGAMRIATDYEDGRPSGLNFAIETEDGPRLFAVPVDAHAMQALLKEKDRKGQLKTLSRAERTSLEHAERVAWRIVKDWLGAQLALIETRMVSLEEVMLPYMRTQVGGPTLFELYRSTGLRELEAPRG